MEDNQELSFGDEMVVKILRTPSLLGAESGTSSVAQSGE